MTSRAEQPGTGSLVTMRNRVTVLWRRLLVLLIGGVISLPYLAVVIWAVTAWNEVGDRASSLLIAAVGALVFLLLCVPAFLSVIRALERTLAEQLLELSIPIPPRRPRTADRARGALFYFGHVFSGALLLFTAVVLLPSALVLCLDPEQAHELTSELLGPQAGAIAALLHPVLIQFIALGLLLLCLGLTIAEGYFLPHYALILLGPSPADRADLAGRQRAQQFRRTVLAREVHDSIGHALTVTTMQAAVAKRSLHTDPTLAEAAVDEIARTGREAVAELDDVLSLLRSEAGLGPDADGHRNADGHRDGQLGEQDPAVATAPERPPRRSIHDIERLAEEARSLGHPTRLNIVGDVGELSPSLVHELHRIVREAVTNSLRHSSAPGLSVSVTAGGDAVTVETSNLCAAKSVSPGRGLESIRQRVELFGGTVRWRVSEGMWLLEAVLPRTGIAARATREETGT